jgi:hypothetical protein
MSQGLLNALIGTPLTLDKDELLKRLNDKLTTHPIEETWTGVQEMIVKMKNPTANNDDLRKDPELYVNLYKLMYDTLEAWAASTYQQLESPKHQGTPPYFLTEDVARAYLMAMTVFLEIAKGDLGPQLLKGHRFENDIMDGEAKLNFRFAKRLPTNMSNSFEYTRDDKTIAVRDILSTFTAEDKAAWKPVPKPPEASHGIIFVTTKNPERPRSLIDIQNPTTITESVDTAYILHYGFEQHIH